MQKDSRAPRKRKGWLVRACQALSVGLLATPAFGAGYERMAAEFARAAKREKVRRVAVLPFETLGGGGSAGRVVSERLIAPLVGGGIEVVERALLESVMREQRLQVSGLVDARSVRELGRILDVEAVVTGTVTILKDDRVEVNARLIDAETARVLSAESARAEKDWSEDFAESASWSSLIPPMPSLDAAAPAFGGGFDDPSQGDECQRSREAADELERALVDFKARYWAQRMRAGLSGASLKRNPGSEIENPEIRSQFYERLRYHLQNPGNDLTDSEKDRMRRMLASLKSLSGACGRPQ